VSSSATAGATPTFATSAVRDGRTNRIETAPETMSCYTHRMNRAPSTSSDPIIESFLHNGSFELVLSAPIIDELQEALTYPKVQKAALRADITMSRSSAKLRRSPWTANRRAGNVLFRPPLPTRSRIRKAISLGPVNRPKSLTSDPPTGTNPDWRLIYHFFINKSHERTVEWVLGVYFLK